MVNLETSHKQLQELVGKKFTIEKLEEILFEVGFELDDVDGDELTIDITPDRLDAVSTIGLARILKSYLGLVAEPPQYNVYASEYEVIVDKSVSQVRPCTACAVVTNLDISEERLKEIIWIQEKMHATFGKQRRKSAIGIYPLEKITWPISYTAKKPADVKFQPLESDSEMSGRDILSKHPKGVEFAHLLEGAKVYPLFIDGADNVLSLPPIINSHTVGKVETTTKEIFVECSGFDMQSQEQLLQNLICILADMGGHVHEVKVTYPTGSVVTPNLTPEKRVLHLEDITKLSGISVDANGAKELLEKMMYTVNPLFEDSIEVYVPPFRTDIWHDVDVIDDVIRAFGVNNIPLKLPQLPTTGGELPLNKQIDAITDLFVGLGLQEVKTLGVTDKDDQFRKMNVEPMPHINLGSTAEKSVNMVRCWIVPELLKFLHNNRSAPMPQKIFECGDVVLPEDSADVLSRNVSSIGVALCQDGITFTAIKQHLEFIADKMSWSISYDSMSHDSFINGRCAKVILNGRDAGMIGEISPSVLLNWGIETPVAVLELQLE